MSIRRFAAVQTGLLLAAMFANASSQKDTVRITVLDSVTRASTTDNNNGVPQNCEQLTFDAYCRSTTNVPLISTLLVQEGNEPPFRISCTIDSRYSRCIPLPKGESFDAKKEKRGLIVYYVDDKGKERKQLYTLVDAGAKASPAAAAAALAAQPVAAPVAPRQSSAASVPAQPTPASPAPVPSVSAVLAAPSEKVEKVRCNFSSTPAGRRNHSRRQVRGQHAIGNRAGYGNACRCFFHAGVWAVEAGAYRALRIGIEREHNLAEGNAVSSVGLESGPRTNYCGTWRKLWRTLRWQALAIRGTASGA